MRPGKKRKAIACSRSCSSQYLINSSVESIHFLNFDRGEVDQYGSLNSIDEGYYTDLHYIATLYVHVKLPDMSYQEQYYTAS